MKLQKLFLVLVCLVLWGSMVGCGKGPPAPELEKALQTQLDEEFKKGLFKVVSFRRMGTHTSTDVQTGENHLLVYFDAYLEFLREYSMADWNALGLEALVHVVGAGAKGIDGISPDGNKKGDKLKVHGTLLYIKKDDKWVRRVGEVTQAESGADPRGGVLQSQHDEIVEMLADINKLSDKALRKKDGESIEHIHSFVRVTRNRLAKRLSTKKKELVIATAHVVGTYYPLGKALAESLSEQGIASRAQQTEGSAENCKMVHHDYVELAVCQNDIAFQAHNGQGEFERGGPLDGLVALCSWYPEPIQIFVLADSNINTVADLKGKAIVVGQRKSGTKVNAMQVLQGHGFTEEDLKMMKEAPAATGFEMLAEGTAAAVFLTEAYPARVLRTVTKRKRIRLLELGEEKIDQLVKAHPFFVPLTIPAHHYKGQEKDIKTVAVTATLVASRNLTDEQVENILKVQYANLDKFIKAHPKGAAISMRHALDGLSIPLHPGATKFFKENKK
mgnify:CR=1 FL=1